MKIAKKIVKIALSLLVGTTVLSYSVKASELRDRRVFFEQSPRLLEAYSTYTDARSWGAKYYFTLYVPENAGEPLEKLIIKQRQGSENIRFLLDETFAFVGQPNNKQEEININRVDRDNETREITLIFDPPIPPDTTFSVGLKPRKNPQYGGVYIFGVRAFPPGSQTSGSNLGIGRFHFYDGDDTVN